MVKIYQLLTALMAIVMFSGFWSGDTAAEQQKERMQIRDESLSLLYKYDPQAREVIQKSYGYATFSNVGVNIIFFSAEGGKGLAHNNKTGENIYMNMASGGVGFGLGIKDFRAVFLFENKDVFDDFVEHGWEANAQADAAAKLGEEGDALNGAVTVAPGMRLYKLTQNGLVVQATVQGTKYWKDKNLNR